MQESGYYPAGAEYSSAAPWNREDPEAVDVNVCVSVSMSRSTTISVDDYEAIEWADSDIDEDGRIYHSKGIDYDFSNCNLNEAYSQQEFSPIELIEILQEYLKADMEGAFHTEGKRAKIILSACQGWTTDELEVTEDN